MFRGQLGKNHIHRPTSVTSWAICPAVCQSSSTHPALLQGIVLLIIKELVGSCPMLRDLHTQTLYRGKICRLENLQAQCCKWVCCFRKWQGTLKHVLTFKSIAYTLQSRHSLFHWRNSEWAGGNTAVEPQGDDKYLKRTFLLVLLFWGSLSSNLQECI